MYLQQISDMQLQNRSNHLLNSFFRPYRQQVKQSESFKKQQQQSQRFASRFSPSYSNRRSRNKNDFSFPRKENEYYYQSNLGQNKETGREYPDFRDMTRTKKKKKDKRMKQCVWDHLYNKGVETQNEILKLHEQKKQRIDIQCTFQPMIRKNSRYLIPSSSNFMERNKVWHDNKIQRIIKQKQEEVTKDLEDCTFQPKLNQYYKMTRKREPLTSSYSRTKSSKSLVKLSNSRQENSGKQQWQIQRGMQQRQIQRGKQQRQIQRTKQFNREEVGKIRQMIRRELKHIQL